MVERQLWNFRKVILRRMKLGANIKESGTISCSCGVPLEVFKLIQTILKEGLEGVVYEFDERKVQWTGLCLWPVILTFLDFNNLGYAQLIIGEDMDCILNYSRTLEVLRIRCHYGFPKHFVENF